MAINRRFHRSLSTLATPTDANHCHITLRAKLLRGCARYPSASLQEQRFINREKDETPCLSDPGPLNIRRPHPHKEQPTKTGCQNVEPNRKEDYGKDCMYRGAELAAASRTGGTPVCPCPTSGTPFGSTTGRWVIGQRRGMPGAEYHQTYAAKLPGPGAIPCSRLGDKFYYRRRDLAAWLSRKTVQTR